jgi:hypothetical protein
MALDNAAPTNAAKMARLNAYSDGGCAVSAPDGAGIVRGFAAKRNSLPFAMPEIQHDAKTGQGNGQVLHMTVGRPGGVVTLTCWVPNSAALSDLAKNVSASKSGRWSSIFRELRTAGVIPGVSQRQPPSAEASAFASEMLAPTTAKSRQVTTRSGIHLDYTCLEVKGTFGWYDGSSWESIPYDITGCDDGGGDVFEWCFDNGYDQTAYVQVDASAYEITAIDSITFTASVVSNVHLSGYGWWFVPAAGTSTDPWTIQSQETACAGTGTTCRIQVHGTGAMYYAVTDDNGNNIEGSVPIVADVPDDAGTDPGDYDLPSDWDSGGSSSSSITASQSVSILNNAMAMGTWYYTQGCALCANGPNYEPDTNTANHYGDCTDFTQTAIKNVLGSAWTHKKINTPMFDTLSAAQLATHGFVRVDSATARVGDIVVRALTTGNRNGHAGVFMGFMETGHIIGWANNGRPATPQHTNQQLGTKPTKFDVIMGYETKFFRPQTP